MAPTRTVKSKHTTAKGTKHSGPASKSSTSSTPSKSRVSKKGPKAPPPKQQKTKSTPGHAKKKKRTYTAAELGVPDLNMITPVGVELPKGKKKGKVFVDDQESMMTILAIVNANKEGQIESKMMKSRQMEEIREARKKEAEMRQEQRKGKLEETKDLMRKKRKRKSDVGVSTEGLDGASKISKGDKLRKKRVSFA